jgi:hypothetical protein
MYYVAVDPDHPQPSRYSHRLVADHPQLPRKLIHLHRETHRGVEGFDSSLLETTDDLATYFVDPSPV